MKLFLMLFATTVMISSASSGSYAGKFEDEFDAFTKQHVSLIQNIQGIKEHQKDYFPDDSEVKDKETQIKLFGLLNFLGDAISETDRPFDAWIRSSGYKNCPNLKEHSPEIVSFSSYNKKAVEEVKTLMKPLTQFCDSIHGKIQSNSKSPLELLEEVKKSLHILQQAKKIANELPSLKEFTAKQPAIQQDSLKTFLGTENFEKIVVETARNIFQEEEIKISKEINIDEYTKKIQNLIRQGKDLSEAQKNWIDDALFLNKVKEILEDNLK